MANVISTKVVFPDTANATVLPGDIDAETVKTQFSAIYSKLSTCEYTETVVDGVKVITFKEAQAGKGL